MVALMGLLTFVVTHAWGKVKDAMVYLTNGGHISLENSKEVEIANGQSALQRMTLIINGFFILSGLMVSLETIPAVDSFNIHVSNFFGLTHLSSMIFIISGVFLSVFQFAVLTFSGRNLLLELHGFYTIGGEARKRLSIQKIFMLLSIGIAYISFISVIVKILS